MVRSGTSGTSDTAQRLYSASFPWRGTTSGAPTRATARNRLRRESTQSNEVFAIDRKSTRLNSSHDQISYAVFCLKKKTYLILFNLLLACVLIILVRSPLK